MTFSRLYVLIRAISATSAPSSSSSKCCARLRPGLVGDPAGCVGDPGALLGELQGGALGFGEDRRLPPRRHQVEPELALPGVCRVLRVHVGAHGAAVDLAGPELDELLGRHRQGRLAENPACGIDVVGELRDDCVLEEIEAGVHDGFLSWSVCHLSDPPGRPNVTSAWSSRAGPVMVGRCVARW